MTLVYDYTCTPSATPTCCRPSSDVPRLEDWALSWNAKFNPLKSSHRLFTRKPTSVCAQWELSGVLIPQAVKTVTHFGPTLTPLSWSEHIRSLLQRLGHRQFILKCLAYRCLSARFVGRLYTGLIRPALEYGSAVFDSCMKAEAVALERVQLAIGRAMLKWSSAA